MTRFYNEGAGKEWGIPDSRGHHIKRMMACKLNDKFYRVLVVKILSVDVVNVFYLDYGNSDDVQVADLRLLHKDFLALPAQVVSVRLWGVQEPQGNAEGALKRLLEKLNDGNYYGFACTKVQVQEGPRRRWSGSMEENGSRPAVILQDTRDGRSIAHSLLTENQATLDMKDYVDGKLEYLDTVALVDESEEKIEYWRQLQIFIREAWEAFTRRNKKDVVVSRPILQKSSFSGRSKATIIDIEENNDSEDEEVIQSLRKVKGHIQVKTSRPKLRVRIVGVDKVVSTPSTPDSLGNCSSHSRQQQRFAQDESFLEENKCCLGIRTSRPKLRKRDVASPGSEDSGVYDDAEDNASLSTLSSLHVQKQRVCHFIKVGPCSWD